MYVCMYVCMYLCIYVCMYGYIWRRALTRPGNEKVSLLFSGQERTDSRTVLVAVLAAVVGRA